MTYAAELYDVTTDPSDITHLVDEIIGKMGLASCQDTKCIRLSGGEQRRLSLAIGLIKQPAVMYLDEPTSGLDSAAATLGLAENEQEFL